MESKFRIGDRVKVYCTDSWVGTVTCQEDDRDLMTVKSETEACFYVHKKQCRKLKKRDELWFNRQTMDIALEPQDSCGWVRYVRSKRQ